MIYKQECRILEDINIQEIKVSIFNLFRKKRHYIKYPVKLKYIPQVMVSTMDGFNGRVYISHITEEGFMLCITEPKFGISKFVVHILGC